MESSTPLMDTIPMNNLNRDREGERRKKKQGEIYVRKWANKRIWIDGKTNIRNENEKFMRSNSDYHLGRNFSWNLQMSRWIIERKYGLINESGATRSVLVNAVNCSLCFMHVHFIHESCSPIRLSPAHSNIRISLLSIASGFLNANSRIALWKNDAL